MVLKKLGGLGGLGKLVGLGGLVDFAGGGGDLSELFLRFASGLGGA